MIMKKQFENINSIDDRKTFDLASSYVDDLIKEATAVGALAEQDTNNEYTMEIGRVGGMCADYENKYIAFEHIKVKSALVVSIENEMEKRHLKQRQTAELLDVNESTFSLIMTGKRNVSMRMAKRLYKELNIDPHVILEFA
jgi:predicted XRE-type DNA-binding protein